MSHPPARTSFAFLMTIMTGIPFVPAAAQANTPLAPVTASAGIPDGTEVHLTLMKDLKSGGNKAGEDVPFEVAQDVYSLDRVLLLPADTPAYGKILQSSRRGMFGQGGKLKFSIDYILAPDKARIPLRSDPQLLRGSDNRTASIATAILLTPLTIFINGHDVSVHKGQEFTMYVSAPVAARPSFRSAPAFAPPTPPVALPALAPAPVAPLQSLFTFANGAQTTGTLIGFDGTTYTVSTPKGMRRFRVAGIKSIQALPLVPVATTAQR